MSYKAPGLAPSGAQHGESGFPVPKYFLHYRSHAILPSILFKHVEYTLFKSTQLHLFNWFRKLDFVCSPINKLHEPWLTKNVIFLLWKFPFCQHHALCHQPRGTHCSSLKQILSHLGTDDVVIITTVDQHLYLLPLMILSLPINALEFIALPHFVTWRLAIKAQILLKTLCLVQVRVTDVHIGTTLISILSWFLIRQIVVSKGFLKRMRYLKLECYSNCIGCGLEAPIEYFFPRSQYESACKTHDTIEIAHITNIAHKITKLDNLLNTLDYTSSLHKVLIPCFRCASQVDRDQVDGVVKIAVVKHVDVLRLVILLWFEEGSRCRDFHRDVQSTLASRSLSQ
ncbi:hypothetical protein PsorP6_016094 [Peronosclerospora sorghi]|uniref:Uncharacterized protein n=1 Tax=Peronosclerospora sorghi TaxID=230839 RepID=A0ACC0WMB2_9STRA|nr:hypothetical protein PsorP6_016094 [Peronosclerospora sorghi]